LLLLLVIDLPGAVDGPAQTRRESFEGLSGVEVGLSALVDHELEATVGGEFPKATLTFTG
jgi:hypothetical protein